MRKTNRWTAAALLATALPLAACESDLAGGTDGARVSLLLTDAPGDLVSAEVEVLEIYLQGSVEGDGERYVLYSGGEVFDLLQLRDGVTAELAEVTIPAGTYHQLRIVTGDITIETGSGAIHSTADGTLHCPSCGQSGLKIKLPNGGLELENGEHSIPSTSTSRRASGRNAATRAAGSCIP